MSEIHVDASSLRPSRLSPPLSKSDAQRALVLAHLLGRPAEAALGDDLSALPADVRLLAAGLEVLRSPSLEAKDIDCRDGGTPLRLLLGQAAVARAGLFRFFGSQRLGERPHRPLLEALREALGPGGTQIREGTPWPIEVVATGQTRAAVFRIAGAESSQFVSSLVLAAAALMRRENRAWTVELVGPTASEGYLDLTLSWAARAGFVVTRSSGRITVDGCRSPEAFPRVPGDWSSIGYLLAIAWRSGGWVRGADLSAAHPDREIIPLLRQVGLTVQPSESGDLAVSGEPRRGFAASAASCPDLIPTLAALACVMPAPSRFTQVEILRGKESDRLEGIAALVRGAGGTVSLEPGGSLRIDPPAKAIGALVVESRADHRLAMAGATLAALARTSARISDPECVAKSFPGFWTQLAGAGAVVRP